ncbi:glutamine amidotransferase [Pelagibius sp.]|uniref:glutamine amidotransferase n=1 Tax=Pelagibius sp. TaxID=1931238 RepID=UPI003B50BEC7
MTKRALAIRHVHFEDLGSFRPALETLGYRIGYREAGLDSFADPALMDADLLVVLGGPIGACEEASYPFLSDEIAVIERRLAARRPTIGICLGAQLMARALGARVYPGGVKEIGYGRLTYTLEGEQVLAPVAEAGAAVLHWHGDTFDLPAGAVRLASNAHYENQAFALGDFALATQFHIEATAAGLERWFIGHTLEIATTPGVDVPALRAQAAQEGPALEAAAGETLKQWLRVGAPA